MTHRHSLTLTSSTLLLSRERPKINVYSQSCVVYISVYSVNHVLLLCGGEREFPSVYSPTSLSFSYVACVFGRSVHCKRLAWIVPRPSHCPIYDCLQYNQKLDGWWEGLGMRLARDAVHPWFYVVPCPTAILRQAQKKKKCSPGMRLGLSHVIMSHPCTYKLKVLPTDCIKTKICLE